MNTPAALRRTFSGNAFRERLLARVADVSMFGLLKTLGYLELVCGVPVAVWACRIRNIASLPYTKRSIPPRGLQRFSAR